MGPLSYLGQISIQQPYIERLRLAYELSNGNDDIQKYLTGSYVCYNAAAFYILLQKPVLNYDDYDLLASASTAEWHTNIKRYKCKLWDGKSSIPESSLIQIELAGAKHATTKYLHVVAKSNKDTENLTRGIKGYGLQLGDDWRTEFDLKEAAKVNKPHPDHSPNSPCFRFNLDDEQIKAGLKFIISVYSLGV
ncbi:hypothetical protein D7V64_00155 [Acinetobacter cumulans]|uniref:Uncharacterized protein n=1 Tax=Acinetobacter cumulans TaxID=2136182 RepID=A0A3A8G9N5_9GAMM|nr:hypothetical protein [Acinetobacter cumulans]RKG55565.1 hypothetical protein D7V64_00155 [Acinetobacter cumulans]